ncbi:hypothetical protein Cni_G27416 [Canna indica]|uniref:Uncharacterized protein n=1 Tax=Canna indica TaxID=4628 RepID=A0AAQ3L143_9LILI|nr:hypothetical protein Cni_G27416 [Canna indica]
MSLRVMNQKAEVLHMNINAAKGLQYVLKANIGPKGTIKMLVGGAGKIKLTKDGNTLLKEMECIHGYWVDGFEIAKQATLEFFEKFKTPVVIGDALDKGILKMVARTTLRTKVLCIRKPNDPIDLFMVEIMHMLHKFDVGTCLSVVEYPPLELSGNRITYPETSNSTTIALLQERFKQLQRVREMREERKVLHGALRLQRDQQQPKWLFPAAATGGAGAHLLLQNHAATSHSREVSAAALDTSLSVGLWPRASSSSETDVDVVDTSLHL